MAQLVSEKYIVVHLACCSEHEDTEVNYFDTLESAKKAAIGDDIIAKVIEE